MLSRGEIQSMASTLNELANATLTAIETPGSPDAYGEPGEPDEVWTGTAEGFLEILDHEELNGGQQVSVQRTTFRLLDAEGAPVIEEAGPDWSGSTVRIEDRRLTATVTRRYSVVGMEHEANGLLDSVLLTLDTETAVS